MATANLSVPDISCEHCERTIKAALDPVAGVCAVNVDIPTRQVRVEYEEHTVDLDRLKAILAEEDYPVAATEPA